MKKFISLLTVLTLVVSMTVMLSGCKKEEPKEDDGQNPIMNFVGNYASGRATILVEADGDEGGKATVTWGSSAFENVVWTMSGDYDAESHVLSYDDCVKTEYAYNDDGSVASDKEIYTGGTGTMTFSEGNEGPYLEWKDDKENVAEGMTFTFYNPNGDEPGIANPWQSAASAEEAAKGAGIDSFEVPAGKDISLGTINVMEYRYMDGLAEASIPIAAVDMTIRKGKALAEGVGGGDISGDYNEYKYDWTEDVDGTEVHCFGNNEGEATKTIWQSGDYYYSITAFGAGGDTDFGLSIEDVSNLVRGIK